MTGQHVNKDIIILMKEIVLFRQYLFQEKMQSLF